MFYALHIGMDYVSERFAHLHLTLRGCVYSAQKLRRVIERLAPEPLESVVFSDATVATAVAALGDLALRAKAGDTVLFSFHGHGVRFEVGFESQAVGGVITGSVASEVVPSGPVGRKRLATGDADSARGRLEEPIAVKPPIALQMFNPTSQPSHLADGAHFPTTGILLYDRMMLVSEFADLLARFPRGVRFISIIDACAAGGFSLPGDHSGQKGKALGPKAPVELKPRVEPDEDASSSDVVRQVCDMDRDLYGILVPQATDSSSDLRIPFVHFAACQADRYMEVMESGTFFTNALVEVLERALKEKAERPLTYEQVCERVVSELSLETSNEMAPTISCEGIYSNGILKRTFLH